MTRKDYIAIAEVIRKSQTSLFIDEDMEFKLYIKFESGFETAIQHIVTGLIKVFEEDNENFDKEKFLTACGVV